MSLTARTERERVIREAAAAHFRAADKVSDDPYAPARWLYWFHGNKERTNVQVYDNGTTVFVDSTGRSGYLRRGREASLFRRLERQESCH